MNEYSWKNEEGFTLYGADWPVKHPRAVIAMVHGQGEHIGRYKHVAEWYNGHDIAFTGFDMQGYGRSEGKRGHAASMEVLQNDIGLFEAKTRLRYPDTPVFLYGHSFGGALCLQYVLQRDPVFAGLIITSPLIRLAFQAPALKVLVGKLLRRIMPTLTLPTGLAANFISHDPAVVKAYKTDPLVHDKLSTAAGIGILEMGEWLEAYSGVFSIPVLLMHGADDKITSAAATRSFSERVGGEVTYKEWPGLWHEMHNEKAQNRVFQFTLDWMRGIG